MTDLAILQFTLKQVALLLVPISTNTARIFAKGVVSGSTTGTVQRVANLSLFMTPIGQHMNTLFPVVKPHLS